MYKDLLRKFGFRILMKIAFEPSMGPSVNGPQSQSTGLVWNGLSYAKSKCPLRGHFFG